MWNLFVWVKCVLGFKCIWSDNYCVIVVGINTCLCLNTPLIQNRCPCSLLVACSLTLSWICFNSVHDNILVLWIFHTIWHSFSLYFTELRHLQYSKYCIIKNEQIIIFHLYFLLTIIIFKNFVFVKLILDAVNRFSIGKSV